MAEFQHADLIPRKYVHRVRPKKMPCTTLELEILGPASPRVGGGTVTPGVSVLLNEEDLELPRKKFLERFIKPALYALEAHIAHG